MIYYSELYHHGIKGQKWGVRRYQNSDGSYTEEGKRRYSGSSTRDFRPTSISGYIAKRKRDKVNKSFERWKESDANKKSAIEKGRIATDKKMEYLRNKTPETKEAYKQANKEYTKANKKNTAYRKGSVRENIGRYEASQLIKQARDIKKQMKADPENRELRREYNKVMTEHDKVLNKANRAQAVGQRRSNMIANAKRSTTIAMKGAAATAAISAGVVVVNKILDSNNTPFRINNASFDKAAELIKKGKTIISFMY